MAMLPNAKMMLVTPRMPMVHSVNWHLSPLPAAKTMPETPLTLLVSSVL